MPHLITHVAQDGSTHFAQVIRELCHDFAPGFTVHHTHLTSLSETFCTTSFFLKNGTFLGDKIVLMEKKTKFRDSKQLNKKRLHCKRVAGLLVRKPILLIHLNILKLAWEAVHKKDIKIKTWYRNQKSAGLAASNRKQAFCLLGTCPSQDLSFKWMRNWLCLVEALDWIGLNIFSMRLINIGTWWCCFHLEDRWKLYKKDKNAEWSVPLFISRIYLWWIAKYKWLLLRKHLCQWTWLYKSKNNKKMYRYKHFEISWINV